MGLQDLLYGTSESKPLTLPSGRTATVHEMTGREQKAITDRAKVMSGQAFTDILRACVDTLDDQPLPSDPKEAGEVFDDMLSGDKAALIFEIRRASLGDDFMFKTKCPNCNTAADWEVNLADDEAFKTKPYPGGNSVRVVEYDSVSRPGLKFRFTLLTGAAETQALKLRNKVTPLTDLILRKPQAWDNEGTRWVDVSVEKLPDALLAEFRSQAREAEGEKDTTVTVECNNCQTQVEFNLLQQQDFILPKVQI